MNRALHWLRARMGVRVVSALAAAGAVAVVLAVAGVALVVLLDHSLRASDERPPPAGLVLGQRIAANFSGTGDAKQNAIDATGKRTDIVQVLTDYSDDSDDPDAEVGSNGAHVRRPGDRLVGHARPGAADRARLLAPGETRVVPSAEVQLADGSTEEVTSSGRACGRPAADHRAGRAAAQPVHQAVDTGR